VNVKMKPVTERLKELQSQGFPRMQILSILYVEKYPIFEITDALTITSDELRELNEGLKLFHLRCPVGHRFPEDSCLHAKDAHYCVECKRWFDEATLKDEIELEIKRLKKENSTS